MRLTRQKTSKRLQARGPRGRYARPSLGLHVCACGALCAPRYAEQGAFVVREPPECTRCKESSGGEGTAAKPRTYPPSSMRFGALVVGSWIRPDGGARDGHDDQEVIDWQEDGGLVRLVLRERGTGRTYPRTSEPETYLGGYYLGSGAPGGDDGT